MSEEKPRFKNQAFTATASSEITVADLNAHFTKVIAMIEKSDETPDLAWMQKREVRRYADQGYKMSDAIRAILDDETIPDSAFIEMSQ